VTGGRRAKPRARMRRLLASVSSGDKQKVLKELEALGDKSKTESTKEFWRALAELVKEKDEA